MSVTTAQLQRQLQAALTHHQAGRLVQADRLYRQVRVAQPNNFDALHLSGTVAYQQGRYTDACELLTRALRVNPGSSVCRMRLGLTYAALGRHPEAEAHLSAATRSDPNSVESWIGLGVTCRVLGKIPEAIACYERVTLLQPGAAQAHDNIGALKSDTQGLGAGIPHFRRAIAADPKHATAWCNLGLALLGTDQFEEAEESFNCALKFDPTLVQARVARALAFQQTYRLDQALAEYEAALASRPNNYEAHSGRLLSLNYCDGLDRSSLFQEHLAFGRAAESTVKPAIFRNTPDPHRRLRIAFLSPDLRAHSVAYFLEPLLRHLDRTQFEVLLYHDHFKVDAVSERLRGLAQGWKNFVGQLNDVVEKSIRNDAPDIIVDLAGHTGLNRLPLLARRLAPVQISYLGYPNTTGLKAMDFRFVDPVTDPGDEDQSFHTERLIRFSSCAWTYEPPASAPAPLRKGDGATTFGSFNNPSKLSPVTLQLWARVLETVPGSHLLLKGQGLEGTVARNVIEAKLRRAGIDLARVRMLGRTNVLASHLELYNEVDIALDAFPYHGTTTTCEALWMGVPVVSLLGDRHASRVGASVLAAVGHLDWIASDETGYVAIARDLASNPERLKSLRQTLREDLRKSVLLDHAGQAARFGAALRACWCERLPSLSPDASSQSLSGPS